MKKCLLLLGCLVSIGLVAQNSPYIHKVYEYAPAPGQFVNVMPEITAEDSAKNMGVDPMVMKRLNDAITEIEGFNSSFHIGAAYFRGVTDYEELWELKLQGLLKEYLRGMPDAEETLNTLKMAYFKGEE